MHKICQNECFESGWLIVQTETIFTSNHFALHFPWCSAAVTTTFRHFRSITAAIGPAKEVGQPTQGLVCGRLFTQNNICVVLLCSNAYYLVNADEFFECGPGLKCHLCEDSDIPANSNSASCVCKQQGTVFRRGRIYTEIFFLFTVCKDFFNDENL